MSRLTRRIIRQNTHQNTCDNEQYGCPTISIKEAQQIAIKYNKDVSLATLIKWIDENYLGHQPGGNGGVWYVFAQKFEAYISGIDILKK